MQTQRRPRPSQLDSVRQYIGVKPDREVAEMVGLTASAVQMYRRKHNIPPSGVGRRKAPEPVTAKQGLKVVEDAATTPVWAWKVVLEPDVIRFVVAPDASKAASVANEAGQVLSIERIGEGLAA